MSKQTVDVTAIIMILIAACLGVVQAVLVHFGAHTADLQGITDIQSVLLVIISGSLVRDKVGNGNGKQPPPDKPE